MFFFIDESISDSYGGGGNGGVASIEAKAPPPHGSRSGNLRPGMSDIDIPSLNAYRSTTLAFSESFNKRGYKFPINNFFIFCFFRGPLVETKGTRATG